MSRASSKSAALIALLFIFSGCSQHGSGSVMPQTANAHPGVFLPTPKSVSPGMVHAPPMKQTAPLPSSAMQPVHGVRPSIAVGGVSYTQLPGSAAFAAAAPDGSLWVLSTQPSGPDKYIWHYQGGTWTNISGLASRLSVAPDGTLYAVNSQGGAYAYNGSAWTTLGGGSRELSAAADGSLYVISNAGSGDGAIWHYASGSWTQEPGSGVRIAASWDPRTYTVASGTLTPKSFYVVNSAGSIYYLSGSQYVKLQGAAVSLAPVNGGIFALGYPANAGTSQLYYDDLDASSWSAVGGSGVSISAGGGTLYVVNASGAIYSGAVSTAASRVQIQLGPSPSSATFPTFGAGYGLTMTLPSTPNSTTADAVYMTALPSTAPTLQIVHRSPQLVGGTISPIAYVTFTPAAAVTFTSTVGFDFTLPSAPQTAAQYGVAMYDPTKASLGWQYVSGPVDASGQHIAVPSSAYSGSPISLQSGTTYIFSLYSFAPASGATPSPAPTPTASPTPPPTANGGTLAFQLSSVNSASKSARAWVNGAPLAPVAVPAACVTSCTISFAAPAFTNLPVRVATYISTDASGLPLTSSLPASTTVVQSQTTTLNTSLMPVASRIQITTTPSTFTTGIAVLGTYTGQPYDANGTALGAYGSYLDPDGNYPNYQYTVNNSVAAPIVTVGSNDVHQVGGPLTYTGAAAPAVSFTIYDLNSPALSVTPAIPLAAAKTGSPTFAIVTASCQTGSSPPCDQYFLSSYGSDPSSPLRSYLNDEWVGSYRVVPGFGRPAFDPNGTLWAQDTSNLGGLVIFTGDGRELRASGSGGTGHLLQFDASGRLYVAMGAQASGSDTLYIDSVDSSYALSIARYISISGAQFCDATSDPNGTVYIAQCPMIGSPPASGIWSFSANSGSGSSVPPSGFAAGYNAPMRVDTAGNVYAVTSDGTKIVRWSAGSFGSSPPVTVVDKSPLAAGQFITDFAISPSGGGCGIIGTTGMTDATSLFSWGAAVCPNVTTGKAFNITAPLH